MVILLSLAPLPRSPGMYSMDCEDSADPKLGDDGFLSCRHLMQAVHLNRNRSPGRDLWAPGSGPPVSSTQLDSWVVSEGVHPPPAVGEPTLVCGSGRAARGLWLCVTARVL